MQDEFPNAKNVCYLNTASEGLLPASSVETIHQMARLQMTPQKLTDSHFYEMPARCRGLIAEALHCRKDEIALTTSTGFGLSAVALSLPLQQGDEVLLTEQDFPANTFAWESLRDRGVQVRKAPFAADSHQMSRILESVQPQTRVLAISAVHFYTGFRYDLSVLSEFCRSRGIFLVLDAVQAAGSVEIDLQKTPVDALSAAGHKWQLSPIGTGFLYVNRDLMPRLRPAWNGWMSNAGATCFSETNFFEFLPSTEAARFELGSMHQILVAAYEVAWTLLKSSRMPLVEKHNLALAARIREGLQELGWSLCATALPSVIVSARPPAKDSPADIISRLQEKQIHIALRNGFLRASPHLYNTTQDVDRLLAALKP